jgi:methionyl-tRNA formyltransferase
LKLQASAVKQCALAHGLTLIQPQSLRLDGKYPEDAAAAQAALQAAAPEVLIVAAYGLILPSWTLTLPRGGCLNIHASLLPRWRGAAPIHRAIEAGDVSSGITIMQMDEGLDTGDMLLTASEPIHPDDTTATLHDRLAVLGGQLIVQAIKSLQNKDLHAVPQPVQGIVYAHKIDKSESRIDWSEPAEVIERRVRAWDPFPGATFQIGTETIKLWRAAVVDPAAESELRVDHLPPGSVIAKTPERYWIVCGDQSVLSLLVLQRPGGKRVNVRAFVA